VLTKRLEPGKRYIGAAFRVELERIMRADFGHLRWRQCASQRLERGDRQIRFRLVRKVDAGCSDVEQQACRREKGGRILHEELGPHYMQLQRRVRKVANQVYTKPGCLKIKV
jgi:hypothetical protein